MKAQEANLDKHPDKMKLSILTRNISFTGQLSRAKEVVLPKFKICGQKRVKYESLILHYIENQVNHHANVAAFLVTIMELENLPEYEEFLHEVVRIVNKIQYAEQKSLKTSVVLDFNFVLNTILYQKSIFKRKLCIKVAAT